MALEKRTMGFKRGEVVLNDDGTFKTVMAWKQVGVWDTETSAWVTDVPPSLIYDKEYGLQAFKNFVAALQ